MTAAIMIGGIGGLGILGVLGGLDVLDVLGGALSYWILVGAVLAGLVVALAWAPRLLRRYAEVSHRLVLVSVGQSMVRLACWCVQLELVIWALGGLGDPGGNGDWLLVIGDCLVKTPIYYLMVTITPNVPIAEVGVRGAWAVVLFGSVNAALAGVLLWAINTLLPCLIWPFFRKK